jgi:hypothetical protein
VFTNTKFSKYKIRSFLACIENNKRKGLKKLGELNNALISNKREFGKQLFDVFQFSEGIER